MTHPVPGCQPLFEAIEEAESASLAGGGLQVGILYGPPIIPFPVAVVSYTQGSASIQAEAALVSPFTVGVTYSVRGRSGSFSFTVRSL